MSTGPVPFLRRESALALLALCLALAFLFRGEPRASAVAPSRPSSATAPAAEASKIETILAALKLSDGQASAYQVALSRKLQIDDPITLTMFLRKIDPLPWLQSQEWNDLDHPAGRNLLAEPNRYAGRPISLRAHVNVVWKWTPGEDFAATADWTRNDGPLYRYDCLNADAQYPASEPLYVLSPVDPNTFLGRPTKIGDDGQRIYGNFPRVRLAGVFYKLYATKDTTGLVRDYPVVLAWQIRPEEGGAEGGGLVATPDTWSQALVAAIILLVGILLYFFWRFRQVARGIRSRTSLARRLRQPPRQEDEEDEETSPEKDQADPGLAAAAEEFRKREGPEGG